MRPAGLTFFGDHAALVDQRTRSRLPGAAAQKPNGWSMPSARSAGPEAVLAYLSRYTHRVAIANSRLIALDETGVTFR